MRMNQVGLLRGQRAITSDGAVNYHMWGKGDGSRPLVLTLHGLLGTMRAFACVAESLVAVGYDVLTFDLFGFGLSAAPHKRFNASLYVKQTLELLSVLNLAKIKFSVIGFSMGGLVGMELARAVPERVNALLLIAPAGLVPLTRVEEAQIEGLRLARQLCIPVASWVGQLASLHVADADFFEPDGDSERAQEASRKCALMYNSNPQKFAKSWVKSVRDMRLNRNHEAYEGLASTGVRTMFLWGDSDETIPLHAVHAEVRRCFPTSPVRIIPKAGHNVLLEHSDKIASISAQWFAPQTVPVQTRVHKQVHMAPRQRRASAPQTRHGCQPEVPEGTFCGKILATSTNSQIGTAALKNVGTFLSPRRYPESVNTTPGVAWQLLMKRGAATRMAVRLTIDA